MLGWTAATQQPAGCLRRGERTETALFTLKMQDITDGLWQYRPVIFRPTSC